MTFGKLERRTFNFMSDTTNTRKYKGYELDQTTSHLPQSESAVVLEGIGLLAYCLRC